MAPQHKACGFLRRRLQHLLDHGHGVGGARAIVEPGQQRPDLFARPSLEFGKSGAALRGQRDFIGAAVGLGRLACDDLAALQRLQGAAEEAGVEAEKPDQIGRGTAFMLRDLVDDPCFLQSPRARQQLRFDDAELAGIEPAEAPDGRDVAVERRAGRDI
jgi:hypothetical protein